MTRFRLRVSSSLDDTRGRGRDLNARSSPRVVAAALSIGVVAACLTSCSRQDQTDGGVSDAPRRTEVSVSTLSGPQAPLPSATVNPPTSVLLDPDVVTSTYRVTRVVDGDTIRVQIGEEDVPVRLIGINAPEDGECYAAEASARLNELVLSKDVILSRDVSDVDRYGRLLRYISLESGKDVGATLVGEGLAIAREYPPDTTRIQAYDALQDEARIRGVGLWAADACGDSLPGIAIRIDVHADAAGDDAENLNDEWVRFTNIGVAAVELDGWSVADESASHRYTFNGLNLEPGATATVFSGCGLETSSERYWCVQGSAVWNNNGDTVFLRDQSGNVVSSLSY